MTDARFELMDAAYERWASYRAERGIEPTQREPGS